MNKYLISLALAATLSAPVTCLSYVLSKDEVRSIYSELMDELDNVTVEDIPLEFIDDDTVNTYAVLRSDGNRSIRMHMPLVELMGGWLPKQTMAFLLSHEIAHHILDHLDNDTRSARYEEYEADYIGHTLAAKAGYDLCGGYTAMSVFINEYGDSDGKGHPKTSDRRDLLAGYCKA